MDYTILYSIGIVVFVIGFAVLIKFLKNKEYLLTEDLIVISKVFDLSLGIIMELNLPKEKEILKIGKLVSDTVQFAISIMDSTDYDEMIVESLEYAKKNAVHFNLILNEKRIEIIKVLLVIGVKKLD